MKKRATRPAKSKPAPAKSANPKPSIAGGCVVYSLPVKTYGLEPILGAAYMLMDRAFAALEGHPQKTIRVTLRPKAGSPLPALARAFADELRTQQLRWALAKNNLPVREFIAEQAVLLANGRGPAAPTEAAGEAAADQLSDEQRREIEKLIAEVEAEIKTMNDAKARPAPADPKGIAASWEEKQESRASEGGA